SPKIRQAKIWQLYQNDALGAVDEILVEDVGLSLLQRCQSIWLVAGRKVECPRCATIFPLSEPGTWKMLPGVQVCPNPGCGWGQRPNNGTTPGNIATRWEPRRCRSSKPIS